MLAKYQQEAPVPLIAGVEIYTSPAALSYVQNSKEYKDYTGLVKAEDLFEKDEGLEAWYPAGGFVARPNEKETGKAGIVVLAEFVAKDGEGNKEKLVQVLEYVYFSLSSCFGLYRLPNRNRGHPKVLT